MAKQQNPYSLRLDEILMDKLKVMADEHCRSVNKEIELLVKLAVEQYEAENGAIFVPWKEK